MSDACAVSLRGTFTALLGGTFTMSLGSAFAVSLGSAFTALSIDAFTALLSGVLATFLLKLSWFGSQSTPFV